MTVLPFFSLFLFCQTKTHHTECTVPVCNLVVGFTKVMFCSQSCFRILPEQCFLQKWQMKLFFFFSCRPLGNFSHGKFRSLSQWKASCNSHATKRTVLARYFSVCIFHWTLTWTTGFFTRVYNFCVCVYTQDLSLKSYLKDFEGYRVGVEIWLWGKSCAKLSLRRPPIHMMTMLNPA